MNTKVSLRNRAQSGASLVVVLILLLVMTLLGLAALRGTLLQERMSANLLDRNLNFQAAEAALREGEDLAQAQAAPPATGSGCVDGMCESPDPAALERWKDPDFAGWRDATAEVSDQASQPQFFVEYLGTSEAWLECNVDPTYTGKSLCVRPLYRIVARSQAEGRASVTLQSSYVSR